MSVGELLMDDSERTWIQREFDTIKAGQESINANINNKPCVKHGEELAALTQKVSNGIAFKDKAWKRFVAIGMFVLGCLALFVAFMGLKK